MPPGSSSRRMDGQYCQSEPNPTGKGTRLLSPQIAAAQFGIVPDQITFRQADTDATPEGGGHGGSRSLQLGGPAVLLAARAIIEKGKRIASNLLEADQHDVEYKPGEYRIAGTDRNVSFL